MANTSLPFLRVLLIEDSPADEFLIIRTLRQGGYTVKHQRVDTAASLETALDTRPPWDIIISDFAMPGFNGMQALNLLKKRKLDIPFIIVSGAIGENTAVELMKNGARDYIMKDSLVRLVPAVERELRQAKIRLARRKAIATIRKMNDDLLKANEELKTIDEMKTNLLSNVSHELRTPLVSIRGFTELVASGESGPLNDAQHQQLNISLKNVDRLLALINNLLDFSSLTGDNKTLSTTKLDLREIIQEHFVFVGPSADAKKIKRNLKIPTIPLMVEGNREKLGRVLANLLDNAIKFSPAGGEIRVIAGIKEGSQAFISVADSGPGIPKAAQKNIFERFYQEDASSTRTHGGIGLGLSLCREIVNLHKGRLSVKSQTNKGSVFTIMLPLAS